MGRFTFRASDEEAKQIEQNAKKRKITTSEYIRQKVFSGNTENDFSAKITFYTDVNSHLMEIIKKNETSIQMVYQLMLKEFGENRADEICKAIDQEIGG